MVTDQGVSGPPDQPRAQVPVISEDQAHSLQAMLMRAKAEFCGEVARVLGFTPDVLFAAFTANYQALASEGPLPTQLGVLQAIVRGAAEPLGGTH